jgi:peptidoglycan/xylan/chitin deacetylase (PgdA/CDA1 family)
MYHRVLKDDFINGLTPQEFEQQIAYVCKHFTVLTIDELIHNAKNNCTVPYSIALTFDDGHYDFYLHAWPILKKYKARANLYITTGFVEGTTWLWPDLLKYILLNSHVEFLTLPVIGQLSTDKQLHEINWQKAGDFLLAVNAKERDQLLISLAKEAGININKSSEPPFQSVTWAQLQEMTRDGLQIGSHTVTHPILSSLSAEDLDHELAASHNIIKQQLGVDAMGICYPNGRPEDINDQVTKAAEAAGYTHGLMARNFKFSTKYVMRIGRIAANKDFFYFKWLLARRKQEATNSYLY